ncbi:hypothetical protein GOC37_33375, partial [Sinorhizobium meliloti]|nr:hypothetical protein [Sinorhizobium meliloti]
RGRLFLGIGGRDHFGIRGRIASEFAYERDYHVLFPRRPRPALLAGGYAEKNTAATALRAHRLRYEIVTV